MNAKEFMKLTRRDIENGVVIDEIYLALKERDSLREQIAARTKDFEEAVIALTDEIRGKDKEIAALTAENKRMQEALAEIGCMCSGQNDYEPVSVEIGMIAQEALRGGEVKK